MTLKVKLMITIITLSIMAITLLFYFQKLEERQQAIINSIQKDDFFMLSISKFTGLDKSRFDYVVAKITEVNAQEVKYQIGSSGYRYKKDLIKAIRLDTLMIDNYFSNEVESIKITELHDLYEAGAIKEFLRPTGRYLFGGLVLEEKVARQIKPELSIQKLNESAIEYYQLGDMETAFSLFKKGAEEGESWAQVNLANMYVDGEGTTVDIDAAIYWLSAAHLAGNKSATKQLVELCEKYELTKNNSCVI